MYADGDMQPGDSSSFQKLSTFMLILFLSVLTLTACNESSGPAPDTEVSFEQMTPAQHLAKAKSIMHVDDILQVPQNQLQEVDRHIDAIPKSAPEYAEGLAFKQQIVSAAQGKLRERIRQKYTSDLEASLRGQGYDIVVTTLNDNLIVASDLLKDDIGRVQFLANIRKNKRDLCGMGFQRVSVSAAGLLSANNTYSLGCAGTKK